MSVDIINLNLFDEQGARRLVEFTAGLGKVQDVIFNVIGWWGKHQGEPNFDADKAANSFKTKLMGNNAYAATHAEPVVRNWYGSNQGENNLNDMVATLRKHFDPRGKLILAGSSRGGHNVMQFCRRLNDDCPYYSIGRDGQGGPSRRGTLVDVNDGLFSTMLIRVDLLWLLDATFDAPNAGWQMLVPGVVRRRGEGYQTTDNGKVIVRGATGLQRDKTVDLGSIQRIPPPFWRRDRSNQTAHDWCIAHEASRKDAEVEQELTARPFTQFNNLLIQNTRKPPQPQAKPVKSIGRVWR